MKIDVHSLICNVPMNESICSCLAWRATAGRLLLAIALLLTASNLAGAAEANKPTAEQEEFFEKRVRPLLHKHCLSCHGPEEQEADLRLDSRDSLLKGEHGPMAVPGDPDKSRLIEVTRYTGAIQMPPEGKLSEDEFAALVSWVKMGLPWPAGEAPAPSATPAVSKDPRAGYEQLRASHWSLQPIRRPELPRVENEDWVRTPVDRFIAAELAAHQLQPSPAVDKRTLLRRVTFDLIGLPPTVAEIAAFEADTSPEAYHKVVERLLASPHYGERWGRHWLDVARYADTRGYVFTQDGRYPYAYTYRDYVIRAFNDDLPFNQFIREQLAADKLTEQNPTEQNHAPQRLAALGFLTVGRRFGNNEQDIIDDRIDVITRGLMGITVGCARCHDHKYDPIPTDDYYSLYGVLDNSIEPAELPQIGQPDDPVAFAKFQEQMAKLELEVRLFRDRERAELQDELRTHVGDYLAQVLIDRRGKPTKKNDDSMYFFSFARGEPRPPIVRRWREYLARHEKIFDPVFLVWHRFVALPEQDFAAAAERLVADLEAGKLDQPKKPINRLVREAFVAQRPKTMVDVIKVYDRLFHDVQQRWVALRTATAEDPGAKDSVAKDSSAQDSSAKDQPPSEPEAEPTALDDPAAEELRQVLYGKDSPAALEDAAIDGLFDRKTANDYTALNRKIESLKATSPAAPPRAMVVNDRPKLREAVVYLRGNPGRRGKPVPRQFLEAIAGPQRKPFQNGSGRLELAEAIVAPNNPLTARVFVNRVWQHHFGVGLVRTPGDFGLRGERPTHPALLDWLAATFMEEGWSIKKLHRLLVLSNTYQQSSAESPTKSQADPENLWLWRMNRRRLEFEAVRDAVLAAADRLDPKVGGRSVDILRPPFSTRRTVYAYVDRQDLPGVFQAFDFASPDVSTDQRPRTTVPQQALYVMNSPFVLEQARHVATRSSQPATAKDGVARIQAVFQACLSRSATSAELAAAQQFLAQARDIPPPPPVWQYGYGQFDPEKHRVIEFQTLPHWTGDTWQGSAKFPDPKLSFLKLTARNGHPGHGRGQALIIRWTALNDLQLTIDGRLKHPAKDGDGVRGRLVSSRTGLLGECTATHAEASLHSAGVQVQAGDTIDLVIDERETLSSDSFEVALTLSAAGSTLVSYSLERDFHGPPPARQDPWAQLAQVLLMTNEFMFVD